MRDNPTFRIGLAMAAGAFLAGCASAAPSASSPSSAPAPSPSSVPSSSVPSSSPAPLPTITKTEKPPREPTDNPPTTGWVAGMVTRGGKGPCYGLVSDEGTRYALYSTAGIELTNGARVKVKLEPTLLRIYCGPGSLMAMVEAETIQ